MLAGGNQIKVKTAEAVGYLLYCQFRAPDERQKGRRKYEYFGFVSGQNLWYFNTYRMKDQPDKKRLLFVITQGEFGGAQRFLYNLIAHLDREKYEMMVASGGSQGNNLLNGIGDNTAYRELASLGREPRPIDDIKAVWELRRLIREFRPDVLFLSSSKAGFVGSLATVFPSRLTGIKVIYRIGGWTFNDPWPRWQKWLWIGLEWLSARWKHIIIVNNRHDLEQARKLRIKPREQVVLIHNGLDIYKMDYLPREEARFRLFEKISRNWGRIFQVKTTIGTVANMYPAKGLEHLVDAARDYRDNDNVAFVIIGDGPERKNLEAQINSLGLEHRVILVGSLPDAHKYMTAFDIFVLPSVKEGFPWALLEAMAAKLPVVATQVGAVPEIIEPNKNGLIVDPGQPRQIAEAVNSLIANEHLRQELAIQAHQTVLFKFELHKMIESIEEFL